MENKNVKGIMRYLRYIILTHPLFVAFGLGCFILMVVCKNIAAGEEDGFFMLSDTVLSRIFEFGALFMICCNQYITPFTIMLPFSRRELWRYHFWIQTVLLGGFGLVLLLCVKASFFELFLTMLVLLVCYFIDPIAMVNRAAIVFQAVVGIIIINGIPLLENAGIAEKAAALSHRVKLIMFIVVAFVGIGLSLLNWKQCEKLVFERKGQVK